MSERRTLAVDIGGTGIKLAALDDAGRIVGDPVRVPTPAKPVAPGELIRVVEGAASGLQPFERVSVGFPGMVRAGQVLSAPHFISPTGPGGKPSKALVEQWTGFDLQHSLGVALNKPTRVANDADVQGLAVVWNRPL